MIITLTGFMGSGKSRVGRQLGEILGWEFTDLDRYIEHKAGMSIPEIFKDGEDRFRALEAEALRDVVTMHQITGENVVIALGGGTVTIVPLRELIFDQTTCIYLQTGLDTIFDRLGPRGKGRPLFKDKEAIEDLLDTRAPLYEKARYHVVTDGREPEEIAREIAGLLASEIDAK